MNAFLLKLVALWLLLEQALTPGRVISAAPEYDLVSPNLGHDDIGAGLLSLVIQCANLGILVAV